MTTNDLLIGMAGAGGDGVMSAGDALITAAALGGYHGVMAKSFGPQIRGGESSFRLRVAIAEVFTVGGTLDVAIALNWDDFLRFGAELPVGAETIVIYDSQYPVGPEGVPLPGARPESTIAVPIAQIARDITGTDKAKNNVVLGLMAGWFGFVPDGLLAGIRKKLGKKGADVLEKNERAFAAGREYAAANPLAPARPLEKAPAPSAPKLLTDGNEMCGAAAIFAGCTFIPTKSEQSDLFQAVFSAHGDVVRPVLAATTVADIFAMTVEAFNIAEEYQTPVILLSDGDLGQRKEIVDPIDTASFRIIERRRANARELERYQRFAITESGISPIADPGTRGGNYLASGIEHNEQGAPTASGATHARMNEKRIRKLNPLKMRRDLFDVYGDPSAAIGMVAWGSVAGIAREALRDAQKKGIRAKLLVPRLLYPVAQQVFEDFFASVRAGFVVEHAGGGDSMVERPS